MCLGRNKAVKNKMTTHSSICATLAWHLRKINIFLTYFQTRSFFRSHENLFIYWGRRAEHLQASCTPSHVPGATNSLLYPSQMPLHHRTKSAWKQHQDTSSGEEELKTPTQIAEPPCPPGSPSQLIHLPVALWIFECLHFKPVPPRLFIEEPGARAHSSPYFWHDSQASLY